MLEPLYLRSLYLATSPATLALRYTSESPLGVATTTPPGRYRATEVRHERRHLFAAVAAVI